jgi:ribosomal-protein-alanine N-acetyltransferase
MKLKTDRLELRPFELADVQEAHKYLSDPPVMQHVEPPFDLEKTGDFIRVHGMAPEPRVYALVERETGKLAGHVIFHRFGDDTVFELGWVLKRSVWGRGYALEISKALIEYAFHCLRLSKVVVETMPQNTLAKKVIEKLGMRKEGDTPEGLELWSVERSAYSGLTE